MHQVSPSAYISRGVEELTIYIDIYSTRVQSRVSSLRYSNVVKRNRLREDISETQKKKSRD